MRSNPATHSIREGPESAALHAHQRGAYLPRVARVHRVRLFLSQVPTCTVHEPDVPFSNNLVFFGPGLLSTLGNQ